MTNNNKNTKLWMALATISTLALVSPYITIQNIVTTAIIVIAVYFMVKNKK